MEVEQPRPVSSAMSYDEVFLERSKSFIKALQELKNLRPQLYSAAEYCENSYLHSEQKQMVLDNLKDYAVRAVVNAVDHLGTVAYKLTDLLEQETLDLSKMELKVSCANQKLLTCQTYTDKEGMRQQQLLAFVPRHHKHYILPSSVNKKVHFSPHIETGARQGQCQARSRVQPSARSLSWHLASETTSTLPGTSRSKKMDDPKFSAKTSGVFQLLDEERTQTKSSASQMQLAGVVPPPSAVLQRQGSTSEEVSDGSRALTFAKQSRHEVVHVPVRSKSALSAFFVKQKVPRQAGSVS